MEMSLCRWEGFTFAELQSREAEALAPRECDKWGFVLPGGESYAQLEARVQVWYEGIERETVASGHGGVWGLRGGARRRGQLADGAALCRETRVSLDGDDRPGRGLRVRRPCDDAARVIVTSSARQNNNGRAFVPSVCGEAPRLPRALK